MTELKRHKHYQCIRAFADGWELTDENGWVYLCPNFHESAVFIVKPDTEGWLPWYATEDSVCPVDGDVLIEYKTQQGCGFCKAECLIWSSISMHPITRYRIVKEHKTPRAKLKKVRYLAYEDRSGCLLHRRKDLVASAGWKRVPSLDLEVAE